MSIPETMRAVRVYAPQDYRLEEVPVPKIGPGEVLIRVLAAGVCAGDVKTFYGARVWGTEELAPYIEAPVTPGHEFVGEVVALGEGAGEKYGLALGDHAVSEQIVPCWQCRFCRRGDYWMCHRHDIFGFKKERAEGAWADYMRLPAGAINYKVPAKIPPAHAALVEPLACAIHAVDRGEIKLGDTVVIAGMGPIGLCMLQVARKKGPGMLIALDARAKRLELARNLGADLAIDVTAGSAIEKVMDLTEGYGCDVYIEATGATTGVTQGLQMIRRLGTFVEFSFHSAPVSVDWSIIGDMKELNVHGAHLSPYTYPLAIRYLAEGAVDAHAIVTHRLPLPRFREGIELGHRGDVSAKVVLEP